ncbi:AAA domain-containing protein [Xylaria castorea]|nr:AAA domain-containing protein [Xylaria castorea]
MACVMSYSTLPSQIGHKKLEWAVPQCIAPYVADYVTTLGTSNATGYRTTIEVYNARYGTRYIKIRHSYWVESKSSHKTFADTILMYQAFTELPTIKKLGKGRVREWAKARGYLELPKAPPYDALLVNMHMDVSATTNGIHHTHREDEVEYLTICCGKQFTAVIKAVDEIMLTSSDPRQFEFALPCSNQETVQATSIFVEGWKERNLNPYQKLMGNAKDGVFGSMDRIIQYSDAQFERQENPEVFMNSIERSVRLTYALALEHQYQDGLSELTSRKSTKALALPVKGLSDCEYPTAWLVIPTSIYHLPTIPRPNEILKIEFIDVPYELPPLPETKVDKCEAITQITAGILRACGIARDISQGKQALLIAYLAEHLSTITHAVTTPELVKKKEEWVIDIAEWMLPHKTTTTYESRADHEDRVRRVVTTLWNNNQFLTPTKTVDHTPLCKAVCTRLGKEWESIGTLAFLVFAPTHPLWKPIWGPCKPVHFKVPELRISEKLSGERYLAALANKRNSPNVSIACNTSVHEDTAKAEVKAVADATVPADSDDNFALFHLWITDFNHQHIRYFNLKVFPAIAHLVDRMSGKPVEECAHFKPGIREYPKPSPPPTTPSVKTDFEVGEDEERMIDPSSLAYLTYYDEIPQTHFPQRGITRDESDRIYAEYIRLNKEQQDFITDNPEKVPHGSKVIAGCPGGGKSHTLVFFAKLTQWDSVDEKELNKLTKVLKPVTTDPAPTVTATFTEEAQLPSSPEPPKKRRTNPAFENVKFDNLEIPENTSYKVNKKDTDTKPTEEATQEHGKQGQGEDDGWANAQTNPAPDEGNGWGSDQTDQTPDEQDESDSAQAQPTPTTEEWVPPHLRHLVKTTTQNVPDLSTLFTYKPTADPQQPKRRIQIVVVGANNEQLNDIAASFFSMWSRLQPDRPPKIIRASVVSTATGRTFKEAEETCSDGNFSTMLEPERLLAQLTKGAYDRLNQAATIWKSPESIESAVKKYMIQNKDNPLVIRILSNLEVRESDPVLWAKESKKTHKQLSDQLVKYLYAEADVIVCTPLVASTLGNIITAQVLIIDEERRMTEASTLIPLTKFRSVVVRVFSGDSKQTRPLVFSSNSHMDKDEEKQLLNPFARQLELPLGTRMEQSRALPICRLTVNYRSKGGVSHFASNEFYDGRMIEASRNHDDPVVFRTRDFMQKITHVGAGGSSIFFNVKGDDNESSDGNSTINRHNAAFVRDVVAMIFAAGLCHQDGTRFSIGIVTPYRAQVKILEDKISELSSAEINRELVDVRTVAGMQGNERDLMIIDLVRTRQTGFIKQRNQGTVMSTRGKYGNIWVGNTTAWSKGGRTDKSAKWLINCEKYHLDRGALFSFPKDTWAHNECERCHFTHKKNQKGCEKMQCPNCRGPHHVRECAKPVANPVALSVDPNNLPEFTGWPTYLRDNTPQAFSSRTTRGGRRR